MKQIEVWADWHFFEEPQLVGTLNSSITRGKEIFSFEYNESWLKGKNKFQIDPQLSLFSGKFHSANENENFGIFLDSSPDRWGRTLMLRREALQARQEQRSTRVLMPSDFLLGVYDKSRMGGLRYKVDGEFKDNHDRHSTPPWTSIRELESSSLALEDDSNDDPQITQWLKLLFAPGSSLGGARPKANVLDPKNNLWIAKFPSKEDFKDVGAWEAVVHSLAKKSKINVPDAKAERFAHKYHTYLTKRFDRIGNKRIHFASAMTLLQRKDGDNHESGASYLEIADFIIQNGSPQKVKSDLEELWKRIVFSIAVSNSDDHLRNHGFILTEHGWELSPAYDINPNESAHGLSLNISWDSNALDFELAREVSESFRLNLDQADTIIKDIKTNIKNWKSISEKYGISRSEQQRMANAFKA